MNFPVALLISAALSAAPVPLLYSQPANHWRTFTTADGLPENAARSVTLGAGGNMLIRHPNSNIVSILNGYDVAHIPAPEPINSRVHESPGGQLWAVAVDGLQELRDGQWVTHYVAEVVAHFRSGATNVPPLYPVRQGRVLTLLPDQLLQLDFDGLHQVRRELILRADRTTLGSFNAMAPAADGGLWISGTRGFVKITGPVRNLKSDVAWTPSDEGTPELKAPPQELIRTAISGRAVYDHAVEPGGAFWLATDDGVLRYAPAIWQAAESRSTSRESEVSGSRRGGAAKTLPALPEDIAAHAEWKTFLRARNGDLWLGGEHDIARRHRGGWQIFSSTNQLGPENVIAFADTPDGRLWCATPDRVWEFDGQNWLGLRGGFERINALHASRNGTLWVASDNGLHRFVRGAWITNDPEDGMASAIVKRIFEDDVGGMTVETAAGWNEFQPDADVHPPRTVIQPTTKEGTYREGALVTLAFSGRDKWKQTTTERLLYAYRLDEREWSSFQDAREVAFADLPVGKHYFQVRAMDRAGNIDPQPARLEFAVVEPWYRETRLVWILTIALAVAIFFAGLAFNRHRRLQLSYAEVERQVAERTRELELANRELVHSQKMTALGTLAAGIAHDFNNILSIVKGSAQIIEENLENTTKVRTRVDRIKTVVQQGAGIVEAMLGFSRGSTESAGPCSMNEVVEDTLKLLGDRFVREVEVAFDRDETLPQVSVVRDCVQQMLLNFIFNAAEAMERRTPSGGEPSQPARSRTEAETGEPVRKRITLATRRLEAVPPGVVLPPREAQSYVAISVTDCGCGISPEHLPRIFEPFFTTKAMSARRGTGLGLSMVYELAKKLEAGLSVETIVGQGSTFTIILPATESLEKSEHESKPHHVSKS